ncbi:MAG: SDR family NAD(P)-dependent oxidoreductase [Clostridiales bacterium]|nr:SDR family NAD(P)-dependent oxidoreductase [Clostridiales bacterium]
MEYVVITGADRGIGFALSEVFVKNGYTVYAGQFMPEWPQLAGLKKQYPEQLHIVPLNVGDDRSVRAAAALVGSMTGRIDYLINCAGIFPPADNASGFSSAFQVNSLGPLRMVEHFLPLMKEGKKKICTFSSETGVIPLMQRTRDFSYCVSKAALNMEMHMLFRKLRPEGFTFRLFHPGWVKTYMSGAKSTVGDFEPEEAAPVAYRYFVSDDEIDDVLILRDIQGQYWPF